MLVFGTKRLRNIGSDLGSAIKGFRKGMEEETDEVEPEKISTQENVSAEPPNKEENATATRPNDSDV
jgi:sec-independent protein translocase protein TatA